MGPRRARSLAELESCGGQQLAIVRYGPDHYVHDDWVYNEANIDASRVVWARDMGTAPNQELIGYFKGRHVWLVEPDERPPKVSPYPGQAPEKCGTSAGGVRTDSPE